jgi:hypothetical protein
MRPMHAVLAAGLIIATFSVSIAKLPPPPPLDDKGKAAAEEKKVKDAAAAEATKQAQARAEDRVAARYIAEQKAKGVTVHPTPIGAPAPAAVPAVPSGQTTGTPKPTTPQGNTPAEQATSAPAKDPAKTK